MIDNTTIDLDDIWELRQKFIRYTKFNRHKHSNGMQCLRSITITTTMKAKMISLSKSTSFRVEAWKFLIIICQRKFHFQQVGSASVGTHSHEWIASATSRASFTLNVTLRFSLWIEATQYAHFAYYEPKKKFYFIEIGKQSTHTVSITR